MIAFTDHADQWELCKTGSGRRRRPMRSSAGRPRSRPSSAPALHDTELSGVPIKQGQRVVMSYRSATFDEEVFEDPSTFNILRDPNPHVGFGGTGAHYCIGANLARMTIDLIFDAIADHLPDLRPVSEPERLRSGWLNGIKHWQVDYAGRAAAKCPVAQ
jgi:cholest-4-en-3-one 26-monooxygenase